MVWLTDTDPYNSPFAFPGLNVRSFIYVIVAINFRLPIFEALVHKGLSHCFKAVAS